jgi:hypothetical protein
MGDFELDLVLDLGPPCSDAIHSHFTMPRRGDKDRQSHPREVWHVINPPRGRVLRCRSFSQRSKIKPEKPSSGLRCLGNSLGDEADRSLVAEPPVGTVGRSGGTVPMD